MKVMKVVLKALDKDKTYPFVGIQTLLSDEEDEIEVRKGSNWSDV